MICDIEQRLQCILLYIHTQRCISYIVMNMKYKNITIYVYIHICICYGQSPQEKNRTLSNPIALGNVRHCPFADFARNIYLCMCIYKVILKFFNIISYKYK